jgi:hypothetical protein
VETKGEEKRKQEKVQNGMPMLKPCHLFLDCAFLFFSFFFRFSTDWSGVSSYSVVEFVACLVLLAWWCMPGCRREWR